MPTGLPTPTSDWCLFLDVDGNLFAARTRLGEFVAAHPGTSLED
jgi:hypothetical protein